MAETPFKRLSYTEAIEILEEVVRSKKKKFEFPVRLKRTPRMFLPVAGLWWCKCGARWPADACSLTWECERHAALLTSGEGTAPCAVQ